MKTKSNGISWFKGLLLCAPLALLSVTSRAKADQGTDKLAFKTNESGDFWFDTGIVKGVLKGQNMVEGLKPVIFEDGNVEIANNNDNGAHGLFIPYRFLTTERRYGFGAWSWPCTGKLLDGGVAALNWTDAPDRPFTLSMAYHWKKPDTLDCTLQFTAHKNLDKFELLMASYFNNFIREKVYVKNAHDGQNGFIEASKDKGYTQLFPRDSTVMTQVNDGRWKFPPYPFGWTVRNQFAAPLGMRTEPHTGVTVLIMAPPEDCTLLGMFQEELKLGAFYQNYFGHDLAAGQSLIAHARLVFGKNLTENDAIKAYEQYLKDLQTSSDSSALAAAFTSEPMPPILKGWVTSELPPPSHDGWIKLFDGKRLYGCLIDDEQLTSGKVRLEDGHIRLDSTTLKLAVDASDIVIRARVKKISGENCSVLLRVNDEDYYAGYFTKSDGFGMGKSIKGNWQNLAYQRRGEIYNNYLQLELRARGSEITLSVNGNATCGVHDNTFVNGYLGVKAYKSVTLIESIEFQRLDTNFKRIPKAQ